MRRARRIVVGVSLLVGVAGCSNDTGAPKADTTAAQSAPGVAQSPPAAAKGDDAAGAGSTAALKTALVGNWKSPDDGEVMAFNPDGTARIAESNAAFQATYAFLEDGSMRVNVPVFGKAANFIYKVEINGDQLTLSAKDRAPRKYDRLK